MCCWILEKRVRARLERVDFSMFFISLFSSESSSPQRWKHFRFGHDSCLLYCRLEIGHSGFLFDVIRNVYSCLYAAVEDNVANLQRNGGGQNVFVIRIHCLFLLQKCRMSNALTTAYGQKLIASVRTKRCSSIQLDFENKAIPRFTTKTTKIDTTEFYTAWNIFTWYTFHTFIKRKLCS